ncbi:MAG: 50S ribosomal protein L24 [Candidatus Moraniibacteriota bacterium]
MKIRLRKNDKVKVLSGKDRGVKGKINKVDREKGKVVVEGVNKIKKHVKGDGRGRRGEIVEVLAPIDISNVQLICPKCGKITRVGFKFEADKKMRVCKKCNAGF